jgi:outer membrane protein assembly factor BamE (lipoprotein component of BamABCDE complex)
MVNMFQKILVASLVALLCAATQFNSVAAEEIRIPVGEQAKEQPNVDMPTKGMSKERVKSLFGEALEEVPAKGQPPISRWRYQEFTVYFDSNTVIHCVRNFQPKASTTEQQSSAQ